MSVKIRLARRGAKKPFYRIVVTDIESPRVFSEVLGTYDPLQEPAAVTLKEDRVKHWISQGAIPTGTVNIIERTAQSFCVTSTEPDSQSPKGDEL